MLESLQKEEEVKQYQAEKDTNPLSEEVYAKINILRKKINLNQKQINTADNKIDEIKLFMDD
jgi:hypothetical protein